MEADPDEARAGLNELELSCFSLGNAECGFVARGHSPQEAKEKMLIHFKQVHAEKLVSMTTDQRKELEKKMLELVH